MKNDISREACPRSTVVDVVEACLDIPLTRSEVLKLRLTPEKLNELSEVVDEFYGSFQVPEKKASEFRPSIQPRFSKSQNLGFDYVSGKKGPTNTGIYEFDEKIEGVMTSGLKQFLLYCHSVVIEDPLPYLLDYFRLDPISDLARVRIPAVQSLLAEYADISSLLRQNIVIPVQGRTVFGNEVNYLRDEKMIADICASLPQMSDRDVKFRLDMIAEENYRNSFLNNQVDYYFPDSKYVDVLRESLRMMKEKFSSEMFSQALGCSLIGKISAIESNSVTTTDLIGIRENEDLFADWRLFLSDVFQRIERNNGAYTDLDAEYEISLQMEFGRWREKITTSVEKGSMRKFLKESTEKIGIGSISGGLTALATGSESLFLMGMAVGAAGGAVQPLLESIKDGLGVKTKHGGSIALQRHFMALGFTEEEISRKK